MGENRKLRPPSFKCIQKFPNMCMIVFYMSLVLFFISAIFGACFYVFCSGDSDEERLMHEKFGNLDHKTGKYDTKKVFKNYNKIHPTVRAAPVRAVLYQTDSLNENPDHDRVRQINMNLNVDEDEFEKVRQKDGTIKKVAKKKDALYFDMKTNTLK